MTWSHRDRHIGRWTVHSWFFLPRQTFQDPGPANCHGLHLCVAQVGHELSTKSDTSFSFLWSIKSELRELPPWEIHWTRVKSNRKWWYGSGSAQIGSHVIGKFRIRRLEIFVRVLNLLFQTTMFRRSGTACMWRYVGWKEVGETWNMKSAVGTWFHRLVIYFWRKSGNLPGNRICFYHHPFQVDHDPAIWFNL